MPGPVERRPRASILIPCYRHVDLLVRCLDSIARHVDSGGAETIVVFNGTPIDERARVEPALNADVVLHSAANLGFGGGNNRAARSAQGEYLVLLNDDAEVLPGWLEELVETADAHPEAAIVGSRILHPDGRLQEAGSVVWSDGSTLGIGRDLPVGTRRYEYLRQVDHVSACSMLIRRSTFEQLGGFDERFYPGYSEDVDLCLSVRRLGHRVLYQPRSRVIHHESQTGGEAKLFLMLRGHELLRQKWGRSLERFAPRPRRRILEQIDAAVNRARGSPRRLLVVDDRLPDPALGSGASRMLDTIRLLAGAGYAVSLFTTDHRLGDRCELQDLGVDVIEERLSGHLYRPSVFYDVALISRPHNLTALPVLRRLQPQCLIVYDAEALFHVRMQREAGLLELREPPAAADLRVQAEQMRDLEAGIVHRVDRVVSLAEAEAEFFRGVPGACPVSVIAPLAPDSLMTPRDFSQRRGMLLAAGWAGAYPTPNSDSLEWFADRVLPLIKRRIPWTHLAVTGADPPPQLQRLSGPSLRFLGRVEDLPGVYDRARVAVAPVLFGAGIKRKVTDAVQHGVPVVTSSVGAEGIAGAGGAGISVCDEPEGFARRVVELLDDRRAWEAARADLASLQERWKAADGSSWPAILDSALMEKALGHLARHG